MQQLAKTVDMQGVVSVFIFTPLLSLLFSNSALALHSGPDQAMS